MLFSPRIHLLNAYLSKYSVVFHPRLMSTKKVGKMF